MEMKQTSLNVGTMDLELATVNPVELLGFSAVLVSQCSKLSCDTALHELTVQYMYPQSILWFLYVVEVVNIVPAFRQS